MQRADARIAAPGKLELANATRANQLIVNQVRRHADNRQVALRLANHFVPSGGRNQMRESFERNHVTVVDNVPDGFVECGDSSQLTILPRDLLLSFHSEVNNA